MLIICSKIALEILEKRNEAIITVIDLVVLVLTSRINW